MLPLTVPEGGLTLLDNSTFMTVGKTESKPFQFMQLELAAGVLEEIFKVSRHSGKGVNVSFGKTITLHYGNKSQHLTTTPSSSHSQLYDYPSQNQPNLALTGLLSHKLAMQKAKEDTAGADEALAKLQSQLASHKQAKQSMQIKYVPDSSKLPPPIKQTAARALKQQAVKTNPHSFQKKSNNRTPLSHDTTRSMPVSPSLGAARAPLTTNSNSNSMPSLQNGKVQRLQAVRIPLVHFLAARPASAKLLAQHLCCKQDDVVEVLQKVGKPYRLDATKWDLTDKTFKELDVWSFPYPNQEDRDLAIGRARSAFDRMRISTQEKLWDKLLPKHDRGKGKILSQLNLHKGPIQQSSTPKIQIQHTTNEEGKDQRMAGDESDQRDRLAPSDAEPMARSKSHGSTKKIKISEKEAQSKRLLSKGPRKATPEPKPKEAHPAVKKGGAQKKSVPKSSEFVNDSDEEDGLEHAVAHSLTPQEPIMKTSKQISAKQPQTKPSNPSKVGSEPKARSDVISKPTGTEVRTDKKGSMLPTKPPAKKSSGASSPAQKSRLTENGHGPTAMKKTLSRQRTTSSPHKPSPLGSSPPTNASDFETTTRSSNSSTPMIGQAQKHKAAPHGVGLGIDGQMSSKRKAEKVDSDGPNQDGSSTNSTIDVHINGNVPSAKRGKTSEPSSSESSGSPVVHNLVLDRAEDFKKYYAYYKKQYDEVARMKEAPQEKVDALMKMHHRLVELKSQITIGLVGT